MTKIRLAIYIGDEEYERRFSNYLMGHYKEEFELHNYSDFSLMLVDKEEYDLLLCGNLYEEIWAVTDRRKEPIVYLLDLEEEVSVDIDETRISFIDKYLDFPQIIDEIRRLEDSCDSRKYTGFSNEDMGIYSLSENEYQVIFALTLGNIISDDKRVILLDLQEDSGISSVANVSGDGTLEDILVMEKGGRFARSRALSCIGHLQGMDFIYPVTNSECLTEIDGNLLSKVIERLKVELGYEMVIINFGSRFKGFFDGINLCRSLYMIVKRGGVAKWREKEFMTEVDSRGIVGLKEKINRIEVPFVNSTETEIVNLSELWMYTDLADSLRRKYKVGFANG